jgi:hypothetical protein
MDNSENWQHWVHRTQDEGKHNRTCVEHHRTQTSTTNVNKTLVLLQTTGGKDEPNIVKYIFFLF